MTTFRDELRLLADQAPEVDLAERTVRAVRRRRTALLGSVAAGLTALALAAATLLVPSGGATTITGRIADALPPSGVDAAAYAYYDWCGKQWEPSRNTASFAGLDCTQWRLVTRTGQQFRVPEAVSVFTEQTPENYMNTAAPLVISTDGRRIAYYSDKDQRYAVRDLADGRIWLTPDDLPRALVAKQGTAARLSPEGRFLGLGNTVVDMETGQATPVPENWWVESIGGGGSPILVRDAFDRLGVLEGGKVRTIVESTGQPRTFSQPSPDGRLVAYLDGAMTDGRNDVIRPYDTVVTVDAATGQEVSRARFREAPEKFHPIRMGGWKSASEVTVPLPIHEGSSKNPPTLGAVTYGIDTGTGRVRELETYAYRARSGDLSLPGF
ncbi:hypothetical protein ABGB14_25120 [Nonomuraea sp. B10E15]|uniref:hypothetical protein n=1 Tax=Nonomuraea sp. B10E15 TaxID=3153560 RepID=UPI00325E7659